MPLIIPYTFVAGTKAKAAEVNADFQAVATEVNTQGNNLATAQANIINLQNNKADINGNSSNVFRVATPAIGNDAINLSFLRGLSNTQLFGLTIKSSGDTAITCEQGAAFSYDDANGTLTDTVIKVTGSDISKDIPQGVNTGYVYLAGSNAGNTVDLIISQTAQPGIPDLPSFANRYVYLGYYTTDDDGNISGVYGAAPSSGVQTTKELSLRIGYPDLTAGVSKSWNTEYTAEEPGWVRTTSTNGKYYSNSRLKVNGVDIGGWWYWSSDDAEGIIVMFPVKKGDTYKASGGTNQTITFYPNVRQED